MVLHELVVVLHAPFSVASVPGSNFPAAGLPSGPAWLPSAPRESAGASV